MRFLPIAFAATLTASLAGCITVERTSAPAKPPAPQQQAPAPSRTAAMPPDAAARQFVNVVKRMEPVAEAECRKRAPDLNCDFKIVVDDRPNQPPNAFQTLDKSGRPILAFNLPLIASVRNADELAFVMGHEAAHHISRHIARQQTNATAGAVIFGGLASVLGGGQGAVQSAQEIGATVGARSYSKDFELEADRLGTIITHNGGFDPVRGAAFFTKLADPGNRFLGTHPPNARRIEIVRQTAATLN